MLRMIPIMINSTPANVNQPERSIKSPASFADKGLAICL
jgi:hypothetical protein